MNSRYSITAEELHDRVIADMRAYCEHFQVDVASHVFGNEAARPLEQTIRMVISAVDLRPRANFDQMTSRW